MRRILALCGAVLCLSWAAAAQENSADSAGSAVDAPASPQQVSSEDLYPWQVSISYEYIRFEFLGSRINLHGFNTSLVRFTNTWFGLEADVAPAWGDSPLGATAKFLFYGGGPRIAYRYHEKFEPWGHVLFGGGHLFPQTAFPSRNAFAYQVGGGVDFKLNPRVYWRVQGDYVGTRFFSDWQNHGQFKTGLVLNF